jgi:mannose-1-phosphate guanylyltransferase
VHGAGWGLSRVRSFIEKPARELARALQTRGLLWNSFVIVGRVASLFLLLSRALPSMVGAFVAIRPALGSSLEEAAIERLYRHLPAADLSTDVLATHPEMLAVLPVLGVSWDDLGDPARALAVRRRAAGHSFAGRSSRRAPEML